MTISLAVSGATTNNAKERVYAAFEAAVQSANGAFKKDNESPRIIFKASVNSFPNEALSLSIGYLNNR